MDRCIGKNVLCVGNVHQTIVDCFVLEAFREYRDDLRDHMSDNTQKRPKSEITSSLKRMRLSRPTRAVAIIDRPIHFLFLDFNTKNRPQKKGLHLKTACQLLFMPFRSAMAGWRLNDCSMDLTGFNRIAIHFPCVGSWMAPGQGSLWLI